MFNSAAGLAVAMWQTSIPCLSPMNALLASGSSDFILQNLPSIVVVQLFWTCAAPGGKASHLASRLCRGTAVTVACVKSHRKMVLARTLFEWLSCDSTIAPLLVLDTMHCVLAGESPVLTVAEVRMTLVGLETDDSLQSLHLSRATVRRNSLLVVPTHSLTPFIHCSLSLRAFFRSLRPPILLQRMDC